MMTEEEIVLQAVKTIGAANYEEIVAIHYDSIRERYPGLPKGRAMSIAIKAAHNVATIKLRQEQPFAALYQTEETVVVRMFFPLQTFSQEDAEYSTTIQYTFLKQPDGSLKFLYV